MIIYRCTNICPHFCEPCEFSEIDMDAAIFKSTICPLGEDNNYMIRSDTEEEFFCLIVGSRSFEDYVKFTNICDKLLTLQKNKKIFIVSDGAVGTDKMAERYAIEHSYNLIVMPADFVQGKKAGFERNERMHKYISTKQNRGVIAFWDEESKGTTHTFTLSKQYSNPLKIYSTKRNCHLKIT